MKLKYTLGALVAAFALAGCSLDVNMYDGVIMDIISGLMVLTTFHGVVLRLTRNSISTTMAVKSPVQLRNMPGSWGIVPSVTATG